MKKIIMVLTDGGNVETEDGIHIGPMIGNAVEFKPQSDISLQLVKQGLTVDDIIKLKNADLI